MENRMKALSLWIVLVFLPIDGFAVQQGGPPEETKQQILGLDQLAGMIKNNVCENSPQGLVEWLRAGKTYLQFHLGYSDSSSAMQSAVMADYRGIAWDIMRTLAIQPLVYDESGGSSLDISAYGESEWANYRENGYGATGSYAPHPVDTGAKVTGILSLKMSGQCIYSRPFSYEIKPSPEFRTSGDTSVFTPIPTAMKKGLILGFIQLATEASGDPEVTKKIALETKRNDIGEIALEHVTDQAVYSEVALKAQNAYTRVLALEHVTDNKFLMSVAMNGNSVGEKFSNVYRYDNTPSLSVDGYREFQQYLKNHSHSRDLESELNSSFVTIAENASKDCEKIEADTEFTGSKVKIIRIEYAQNTGYQAVSLLAILKMKDQAALFDIAKNAKSIYVRMIAAYELTDQAMLSSLVQSNQNKGNELNVQLVAVLKLKDRTLLRSLAKQSSNWFLHNEAEDRLNDLQWHDK